ncbi:DUF2796 domain-containing protein [Pseudahrensia aquimaris]|uniref:DUF2796 domain-containing protein n=1 Tax=Pseudahrensia aquimaris TaxID=744461 RepID=A0ABW3FG60_9HYPH
MRTPLTVGIASLAILATSFTPVLATEKRELDSHEHGHVKLEIAIEGNAMEIKLEAPGESIVGFEHAAKTDDQKAAVAKAREQLSDANTLFVIPADAGCTVQASSAELHQHGNHNEFEGEYTFNCTNTAALASMETKLFSLYPSIEEIDVDYVSANGQGSVELEADSPRITFAPAG